MSLQPWESKYGPAAERLMDYQGKRMYRVPVYVRHNSSRHCCTIAQGFYGSVIARSATEAANYVRDEIGDTPEVEIFAYGPKGGMVHRYIGWFSAIGASMWSLRDQITQQNALI